MTSCLLVNHTTYHFGLGENGTYCWIHMLDPKFSNLRAVHKKVCRKTNLGLLMLYQRSYSTRTFLQATPTMLVVQKNLCVLGAVEKLKNQTTSGVRHKCHLKYDCLHEYMTWQFETLCMGVSPISFQLWKVAYCCRSIAGDKLW